MTNSLVRRIDRRKPVGVNTSESLLRLLILSQYFWPENFIINDIVRKLGEQGHEVTVATGKPNYPDGEIFKGYRAGGAQREQYLKTVEVFRVPLWPRGEGGAINLTLNYLSFVLTGLLYFPWLLRKREFDAILVFAPSPLIQVIPAIFLKWLKRAHLTIWIQDLWPESLAATGFVRRPWLLKMVGYLVRGIYCGCDTLLVQSQAFVDQVALYAQRNKIFHYPNSIDTQLPVASADIIPAELTAALKENFCVVFTGNLGTAQGVETLLAAAIALQNRKQIRLVLVGSGSRLAWLQAQKQEHQLDNLLLPGRFSMAAMPQIFERANVLLVSLKDEDIFAQTIPSKIQAYLAAGRPIIAALRGEGARIVIEAGAGEACAPEDPDALVALICNMQQRPVVELQAMGLAGKAYFNEHFEMNSQVRRLVDILETRIKGQ